MQDRPRGVLDRLHDLRDYPFKVVELASTIDEEQVAEVFVRINSEGVTLNQADFILTLMSVFVGEGPHESWRTSLATADAEPVGRAITIQLVHPARSPSQLLRVSVALGFPPRPCCKHVYSLLRGAGRRDRVSPDPEQA